MNCSLVVVGRETLPFGAHVNIADSHGFTALHLAVFHNHEMTVKCLLDRGASANCRTLDGKTVRDLAYGMQKSERYGTQKSKLFYRCKYTKAFFFLLDLQASSFAQCKSRTTSHAQQHLEVEEQ